MSDRSEEVIASILRVAEARGVPVAALKVTEWKATPRSVRGVIGAQTVYDCFGSWPQARHAAASRNPEIPPPPMVPDEERPTDRPLPPRQRYTEQDFSDLADTPSPPGLAPGGFSRSVGRSELGTLLVIPDAHAHPHYDNERFEWLRDWIGEHQPEHIVCLGDWFDLPSICSHSSAAALEGHRLKSDLDVGWEAMRTVWEGWQGYDPKTLHFALGNHEARVDGLRGSMPFFDGWLPDSKWMREGLGNFGWCVSGFKETANVCGFAVSHFLPSGVMGRPTGGVNQGRSLQTKGYVSTLVGHSHVRNEYVSTDYLGDKLLSINPGCFVHRDSIEGWNRSSFKMYWRGVVAIELTSTARGRGFGDHRWVSADAMRRRYGR